MNIRMKMLLMNKVSSVGIGLKVLWANVGSACGWKQIPFSNRLRGKDTWCRYYWIPSVRVRTQTCWRVRQRARNGARSRSSRVRLIGLYRPWACPSSEGIATYVYVVMLLPFGSTALAPMIRDG